MPAETFIKYMDSHFGAALDAMQVYKESRKQDDLYQVRVNLKKVRAGIESMRRIRDTGKLKRISHRISVVFREAGAIREAQLQLTWLKQNKLLRIAEFTGIENTLVENETRWKEDYSRQSRKLKRKHGTLVRLAGEFEADDIEACFFNFRKSFREMIQARITVDSWHDLRKLTKKMIYSFHWLPKEQTDFLNKMVSLEQLDKLQTSIGQWHDEIVRKDWLGNKEVFLAKNPELNQEFRKAWHKILASEIQHSKRIRSLLRLELRKLENPVVTV